MSTFRGDAGQGSSKSPLVSTPVVFFGKRKTDIKRSKRRESSLYITSLQSWLLTQATHAGVLLISKNITTNDVVEARRADSFELSEIEDWKVPQHNPTLMALMETARKKAHLGPTSPVPLRFLFLLVPSTTSACTGCVFLSYMDCLMFHIRQQVGSEKTSMSKEAFGPNTFRNHISNSQVRFQDQSLAPPQHSRILCIVDPTFYQTLKLACLRGMRHSPSFIQTAPAPNLWRPFSSSSSNDSETSHTLSNDGSLPLAWTLSPPSDSLQILFNFPVCGKADRGKPGGLPIRQWYIGTCCYNELRSYKSASTVVAEKLIAIVQGPKSTEKRKRWRGFKYALASTWKKKDVSALQMRLAEIRQRQY
ncbi:uncharacterized protein BDR25DRAFT_363567 [Lindgomyces ingoldianus]|uniref:Uncharacterized protein n=1 Tax=Lindgomyces ingoldianus TaxID=673940 RepID=A0ACB6Q9A4_9PLEO|nr:uncharacterized protein BDR25DRAFT_363567 [Lindgomyces ingoldianus]KAF2462725.1 hypothetical protein BDR25DRAFT_363567 [Lindgomyces ingoldianus]